MSSIYGDAFEVDDNARSSYWKAMKLAIAIACIRSKPPMLSAEEYVLQMHNQFWKSHLNSLFCKTRSNNDMNESKFNCQTPDFNAFIPNAKCNSFMSALVKCTSKFEEIKPYFHNLNPVVEVKSIEYNKMEKELLQNCLAIVKVLKEVVTADVMCVRLPNNVIFAAVNALCKGVEIFEKYHPISSFVVDTEEKSLHVISNQILEFVSELSLRIMNATDHKFQKLCCYFLIDFLKYDSLKLIVAKQVLYWILWVKQRLLLLVKGELSWNDEISLCLNNVAHMFKLFEQYLALLMQQTSNEQNVNNNNNESDQSQSTCRKNYLTDVIDNDFLSHAQQMLQENLFQCSGRFPLFSNWIFKLGFKISTLLQNI